MTGVLQHTANLYAIGGPAAMGAEIIRRETARGFTIVRPGEVRWLDPRIWSPRTIVSLDEDRVRLVALEARQKSIGSFRRLLELIYIHGKTPVVVEPNERLARTLCRWNWKHRRWGMGDEAENIWHPRPNWEGETT